MDDYISREAAVRAIDVKNIYHGIIEPLQEILRDIPAADVRPVAMGKWVEVSRPTSCEKAAICECSVCGDTIWVYDGHREWKYCPHCGAYMRHREEGNDA